MAELFAATDVPLAVDVDGLRLEPFDRDEVRELFDFLEFRTLRDRLIEAFGEDGSPVVYVRLGASEKSNDMTE